MKLRLVGVVVAGMQLLAGAGLLCAADKKAPPMKPAGSYAASDAHPNEHLTVAAEPCQDQKECPFFRLPYLQHGFVPVRVIFTNDSDRAISLDDARIQLISVNKDVIPAASEDDLQRRLFTFKSVSGRTIPLPSPLPPIHTKGKGVDKKITEDDRDFGFAGTTVNAHTTLGGYLFYDVRGLDDPVLQHATIYVKKVHSLDGKNEMFAFTVPLDKWLATHGGTAKPTDVTGSKGAAGIKLLP